MQYLRGLFEEPGSPSYEGNAAKQLPDDSLYSAEEQQALAALASQVAIALQQIPVLKSQVLVWFI
jgi:GAF domain-containing protein